MTEEQFEDDFLFDEGEDGGSGEASFDGAADDTQQEPFEDDLTDSIDEDQPPPFGVPDGAEASFPKQSEAAGEPFGSAEDAGDETAEIADAAVEAEDDDLEDIFLVEGLDPVSLDSMFETPATDAVAGDEVETEEDLLFGEVPPAAGSAFDGASPKGRFHERGADVWAGDDIDLDELVGASAEESAAQLSPAQPEPVEEPEEEEYAEAADDLFQMEDVEVELVDGPQPESIEPDSLELQGEPEAESQVGGRRVVDWNDIQPIASDGDESWVEVPLAEAGEGFGAGRNDEYFSGDEQAIDPEELEISEDQPEGLDPLAENWEEDEEQEPLSPDHEDYDPIYGPEARQDEDEEYWEEEPDWRTYEDEYVDETEQAPGLRVVGPGSGRRSRLPILAAAAAVLLVTFAGGVAMLRPEWVWPGDMPSVVQATLVKKPVFKPVLAEPTAPELVAVAPELEPETTPETDPQLSDPVAVVDPETTPEVVEPEQVTPESPVILAEVDPQDEPSEPVKPVGQLSVGEEFEVADNAVVAAVDAPFPELAVGSRAFAQLHNESFFIGVVKKRDTTHVTLRLNTGEVSLAYASLQTLAPLADADTGEVTEAADGFVRLSNDQRIYGTLIRSKNADGVILRTEDSRIQVPHDDVAEYGVAKPGDAEPVFEDDDAWLDEQVQRRMHGDVRRGSPARPTTPPTPGSR